MKFSLLSRFIFVFSCVISLTGQTSVFIDKITCSDQIKTLFLEWKSSYQCGTAVDYVKYYCKVKVGNKFHTFGPMVDKDGQNGTIYCGNYMIGTPGDWIKVRVWGKCYRGNWGAVVLESGWKESGCPSKLSICAEQEYKDDCEERVFCAWNDNKCRERSEDIPESSTDNFLEPSSETSP